jgi:hypothetical protein
MIAGIGKGSGLLSPHTGLNAYAESGNKGKWFFDGNGTQTSENCLSAGPNPKQDYPNTMEVVQKRN